MKTLTSQDVRNICRRMLLKITLPELPIYWGCFGTICNAATREDAELIFRILDDDFDYLEDKFCDSDQEFIEKIEDGIVYLVRDFDDDELEEMFKLYMSNEEDNIEENVEIYKTVDDIIQYLDKKQ